MIDLRYVKKLIEMLDASTVDSIEISSDKGMKLRIAKSPQGRGAVAVPAPLSAVPAVIAAPAAQPLVAGNVAAPAPSAPPQPATAAAGETAAPVARPQGQEIKSPMVGTFYSAAEPSAPPYASVGQRVTKGQVVCIIEAMKIMNEIESDYDGVITEVLAANAHPVEYGQALFRVDTNG